MKSIDPKCRKCDKLKEFLSYDGTSKIKIHIVCYDKDIHHYELFPRFTLIPLLGKKQINQRLGFTGQINILLMLLSIAFVVITALLKSFLLLVVGVALFVMALYTFLQLHFIDLKLIRIFEVAFDNETYWNLKNMELNNPSNRVHEIHAFPEEEEVQRLSFRVPIITNLVSYCLYLIRLVKHDIAIQKYLKHGSVNNENDIPERLKQEIDTRMESIQRSIKKLDLKVLDRIIIII